jgi:hypothetical protein
LIQRLKSWESPRRKGRNDKGKRGSARARQIRKQQQMLRQKLKDNSSAKEQTNRRELIPSFIFGKNICIVIQNRRHRLVSPIFHHLSLIPHPFFDRTKYTGIN